MRTFVQNEVNTLQVLPRVLLLAYFSHLSDLQTTLMSTPSLSRNTRCDRTSFAMMLTRWWWCVSVQPRHLEHRPAA